MPAASYALEKTRLENSYKIARDAFDTIRAAIWQKVGTSSRAELLTHVMRELATHVQEYGCGVWQDVLPSGKPIW
jgi:hypothetical protein